MKKLSLVFCLLFSTYAYANTPTEMFAGKWTGRSIIKVVGSPAYTINNELNYLDQNWVAKNIRTNGIDVFHYEVTHIKKDKSFFTGLITDDSGYQAPLEGYCWINACTYSFNPAGGTFRVTVTETKVSDQKMIRQFSVVNKKTQEFFQVGTMTLTKQ